MTRAVGGSLTAAPWDRWKKDRAPGDPLRFVATGRDAGNWGQASHPPLRETSRFGDNLRVHPYPARPKEGKVKRRQVAERPVAFLGKLPAARTPIVCEHTQRVASRTRSKTLAICVRSVLLLPGVRTSLSEGSKKCLLSRSTKHCQTSRRSSFSEPEPAMGPTATLYPPPLH